MKQYRYYESLVAGSETGTEAGGHWEISSQASPNLQFGVTPRGLSVTGGITPRGAQVPAYSLTGSAGANDSMGPVEGGMFFVESSASGPSAAFFPESSPMNYNGNNFHVPRGGGPHAVGDPENLLGFDGYAPQSTRHLSNYDYLRRQNDLNSLVLPENIGTCPLSSSSMGGPGGPGPSYYNESSNNNRASGQMAWAPMEETFGCPVQCPEACMDEEENETGIDGNYMGSPDNVGTHSSVSRY